MSILITEWIKQTLFPKADLLSDDVPNYPNSCNLTVLLIIINFITIKQFFFETGLSTLFKYYDGCFTLVGYNVVLFWTPLPKNCKVIFKSNDLKCPTTIRVESGKRSGIVRYSNLCVYKYLQPLKDHFSHLYL